MEGHHLHIICIIYNEIPVDCLRNLGSKTTIIIISTKLFLRMHNYNDFCGTSV